MMNLLDRLLGYKKGQGLSLTVIIVAVLAIFVLVVLVLVFTGRMTIFAEDVSNKGATDLATLKIIYGKCHPTNSAESTFLSAMESAGDDQTARDSAYDTLSDEVDRCKDVGDDEVNCEALGCKWS